MAKENVIMPFHKIRGHVNRRGLYLNTEQDSQYVVWCRFGNAC